jgi:hypothetical protein
MLLATGRSLLLAAAGLVLAAAAEPAPDLDLVGTWHVLVHFTDANAGNPEAERWDDRVWIFERKGSQLRWIEYPLVVFSDESGRFEALGSNPASRVLAFWEPNEAQRAQIAHGLEVNPRGRVEKGLRGSDAAGWRSDDRARPGSASVLTYVESWSIEGLPGLPVFTQVDVLGSGRSDSLEGMTRYTATEVRAGGDEITGRFERDGTRRGSFRIRRAGAVRDVEGSGRSQGQRALDALRGAGEEEQEP